MIQMVFEQVFRWTPAPGDSVLAGVWTRQEDGAAPDAFGFCLNVPPSGPDTQR